MIEAEELFKNKPVGYEMKPEKEIYTDGFNDGYNLAKKGNKTSYIKGMRHLANALKEYDRTFGAWTDYFENTVDKVLKQELEKETKQ